MQPSEAGQLTRGAARTLALWESGALTADFDDLEYLRDCELGGAAAEFLGMGSDMVFADKALHLGGNRVLPALWLDLVSREIAAAAPAPSEAERAFREKPDPPTRAVFCDWLLEQGRPVLAEHVRVEGQRGVFGAFGAMPSPRGFDAVLHWAVEQPGGLKPLAADDSLFAGEGELSFARQAWDRGDRTLRRVVASMRPQWAAPWQDAELRPRAQGTIRRYVATERYTVGEWLTHPRFGQGQVETVEARKVLVRFGRDLRPLAHGG